MHGARPRVSLEDIRRAAVAGAGVIRETPVLTSQTLARLTDLPDVLLKAENLQRTGSFKVRGALAKITALADRCANGVVTASAGNHAQAVALAARARGVRCEVFMPTIAPIAKVEAASGLGAEVRLVGATVDDALEAAVERAAQGGLAFVHPFDDPEVVAGQGGIGLELLEQVPALGRVFVPVGGGGLISGVAVALKTVRPEIEVIGVQVEAYAALAAGGAASPDGARAAAGGATIADGIAVKRPGELTRVLIERWVDDLVTVSEDEVAEAMVFLMERAKLVVEGAGAVGVAALLARRPPRPAGGATVVILSGGNVDAGLLADIARRHESQAGRRLVLQATLPDRPGSLASLLSLVAERGANLLDVQHIREGVDLHVRESAVQLVVETRGPTHAVAVAEAVRGAGYPEPKLLR